MNMDQTIERWFFKNEVCVWTTCCFRFFCQWTTFSLHFALLFGLDLVRGIPVCWWLHDISGRRSPIGSVAVFCFLFNVVGFGFPILRHGCMLRKKTKTAQCKIHKVHVAIFFLKSILHDKICGDKRQHRQFVKHVQICARMTAQINSHLPTIAGSARSERNRASFFSGFLK